MSDITITDADREAAENFRRLISTAMLQYEVDDVVKAFARHRLAAVAEKVAEIERLRDALRGAADLIEQYVEFLHRMPSRYLEEHPYIPTVEDVLDRLRAALKETSDGL